MPTPNPVVPNPSRLKTFKTPVLAAFLAATLGPTGWGPMAMGQATIDWIGGDPGGDFFDVSGNWVGGVVPGAADTARFNLGAPDTVNWDDVTGDTTNAGLEMVLGEVFFINIGSEARTHTVTGPTSVAGPSSLILGGMALMAEGPFTLDGSMALDGMGSILQVDDTGVAMGDSASFTVENGGDATFAGFFDIGTDSRGTLFMEADASLTTGTVSTTFIDWGAGADGLADIDILAGSTATFNNSRIDMGDDGGLVSAVVSGGSTVTSNTLNVGAGSAGEQVSVSVTGTDTVWTQNGASTLTLGNNNPITAPPSGPEGVPLGSRLFVGNGAVFNTGTGLTTINASGTLDVGTGGDFNAGGDILVDGGTVEVAESNALSWASGGTMTVSNGGDVDYLGSSFLNLSGGRTLMVDSGSTFDVGDVLNVGFFGDATLIVDNASLTTLGNGPFAHEWGRGTDSTSNVTFRNNATFEVMSSDLRLANNLGGDSGISATVLVESGSTVTSSNLFLSVSDTAGAAQATLTVTGADSTWTQTGASTLTIGNNVGTSNAGDAQLIVTDGGQFNTGTGQITVNASGILNASGGSVSFNGPLRIDGGVVDPGSWTAPGGWELDIVNDGTLNLANITFNGGDFEINSGGLLVATSTQTYGLGHVITVSDSGTIEAGGNLIIQDTAVLNADDSTNLAMAPGTELIARDGGAINVGSFYEVNGHTLRIENGGVVTLENNLDVGFAGPAGTLIVDNATLTTSASNATTMDWGDNSGADVDIINGSMVTLGADLQIAFSGGPANVAVNTGSTVIAQSVKVGDGNGSGQIFVNIDGVGTTFTQQGASTLNIGGSIAPLNTGGSGNAPRGGPDSEAEMGIRQGAVYTAGTGDITVGDAGRLFVLNEGSLLRANTINVSEAGSNERLSVFGGGTLQATTINGNLNVIGGRLDPYGGIGQMQEVGTMTVNGSVALNNPTIVIDISGDSDFDSIQVSGDITPGGTMKPVVNLRGGYRPIQGQQFDFLVGGNLTGFFEDIDFDGLATELWGVAWSYSQSPFSGFNALAAEFVCADGDFNCDGMVDLLDLDILGSNWNGSGKIWGQGDANGDRVVDLLDLDILGGNWGFGTSGDPGSFAAALAASGISVNGSVPEPTSALLIVGGALAIAGRRRRHAV